MKEKHSSVLKKIQNQCSKNAFKNSFLNGQLQLFHLNFGVITLLPKEEAMCIEQFKPICLLNVSFNFFLLKLVRSVSRRLHIRGSIHGRYSLLQKPGSFWILGVPGERWQHMVLTIGLDDNPIIGQVFSHLDLFSSVMATFFCFSFLFSSNEPQTSWYFC